MNWLLAYNKRELNLIGKRLVDFYLDLCILALSKGLHTCVIYMFYSDTNGWSQFPLCRLS